MPGHHIKLALNSDGVSAEFFCDEPKTAECHQECDYGCEVYDKECIENHPRGFVSYCNTVEYLNNTGMWYETFVGEEAEPHSGPIASEWVDNDWFGWRYEDKQWEDWGSDENENTMKLSWIDRIRNNFSGKTP